MEQVYIQEANSEILVMLDKHFSTRLSALEEAAKILAREVLREQAHPSGNPHWNT